MESHSPEMIRDFGWNIQRVISGEHLTRGETRRMFSEILLNQQPELQQGALLAALRAKGESTEEIVGAWEAIRELDTNCVTEFDDDILVDNSGTGMDGLKTFNVSTASAIVAAACGVRIARHGSRGLTSSCGTVDVLEALGLDVDCSVSTVADSVRKVGLGLFNGMSAAVHPGALGRILSQIRFGSTLNVAASLASPCRPTYGLRGVHSANAIEQIGAVMRAIGYRRALVVFGWNSEKTLGMDELSTLGESEWLELAEDGTTKRGVLVPESVGLPRACFEDISSSGNIEIEATRLLEVLAGTNHAARQDLVCLNAGAIIYLVGRAATLAEGVRVARQKLGIPALTTLVQWLQTQAAGAAQSAQALNKLRGVADRAGQSKLLEQVLQGS